jgi:hypothetical protein
MDTNSLVDWKRLGFLIRQLAINLGYGVLPFSTWKRLFPTRMTGRGRPVFGEEKINRYLEVFRHFHGMALDNDFSWQGKTLVEIGPGDNIMLAVAWVVLGAKSVITIDRFPYLEIDAVAEDTNLMISKIVQEYGVPSLTADEVFSRIRPLSLDELHSQDLCAGSVDLIYSNATLEHIHDLSKILHQWRNWLSVDGAMIHWVDFKSHNYFVHNELDFLTFSDRTWHMITSNRSAINRQRWEEHQQNLTATGFTIVRLDLTHYPKHIVDNFLSIAPNSRWSKEELLVSRAFYFCLKNPDLLSTDIHYKIAKL